MSLYERDFAAWAAEQAELARARSHNELDWENVAEELDSLGRQQRSELRSRYKVLLTHLLKGLHQPERKGESWRRTISSQRAHIELHVEDSPSLKSSDDEVFAQAYRLARLEAARQTRLPLDTFPVQPPFTPEQARDDDFWPEPD